METVNIQWQSLSGQWMVSDLSAAEWQPLAVWADRDRRHASVMLNRADVLPR